MEPAQRFGGRFGELVYDLLAEEPRPFVHRLESELVELSYPSGSRAVLLHYLPGQDERCMDLANALMREGANELVLVGGPPEAHRLLERAKPVLLRTGVMLYHLPEEGPLWRSSRTLRDSRLGKRLLAGPKGPIDAEAFRTLIAQIVETQGAAREEADAFATVLGARKPIATLGIAVVIVAMFALEMALGGSEQTRVLVRLGALVPERIAREPWRLFSSAFLHAGFMHVLLNTYVLYVIGGVLERVLGSFRFLVVFFLSVLGGSLASLLFGKASVTVGASGGIWGLLAAEAVLAYRPRGLLPQLMLPGARRAAMTNLVINVVNSLRPQVSMSAHFGGGLVGALLLLPSFFTAGLPKLEEGETERRRDPLWLRALALTGALVLLGSVGAALVQAGGLRLLEPPRVVAMPIGSTGLTIELPEGIKADVKKDEHGESGATTMVQYGEVMVDPAVFSVSVFAPPQPITKEAMPAELDGLKQALSRSEEGFHLEGPPLWRRIGDKDVWVTRLALDKGDHVAIERMGFLTPTFAFLLEVVYWKSDKSAEGAAERVIASIVER